MAQKGLGQNEAADFAAFMGNAGRLLVFWLEPLDTGPICRQHTEMVPRDLDCQPGPAETSLSLPNIGHRGIVQTSAGQERRCQNNGRLKENVVQEPLNPSPPKRRPSGRFLPTPVPGNDPSKPLHASTFRRVFTLPNSEVKLRHPGRDHVRRPKRRPNTKQADVVCVAPIDAHPVISQKIQRCATTRIFGKTGFGGWMPLQRFVIPRPATGRGDHNLTRKPKGVGVTLFHNVSGKHKRAGGFHTCALPKCGRAQRQGDHGKYPGKRGDQGADA